jgi:hypothetical protein
VIGHTTPVACARLITSAAARGVTTDLRPPRLCTVPGCDRRHCSLGFCDTHYARLRKHGTLQTRRPIGIEFAERVQTIAAWARERGLSYQALYCRLKAGWPVEEALAAPLDRVASRRRGDGFGPGRTSGRCPELTPASSPDRGAGKPAFSAPASVNLN